MIAARPPLPGEDRTILDAIAAAASTLSPAPLSEAAIATLAGPGADPAFVTAVHDATAGNALLVEEVLAEARERPLHTTGIPGPGPGIARCMRLGCECERIARRVALRLAGLGAAAAPLAAAVAVLGDGAELAVAARLADLAEEAARGAAAELVAADLFEDDRLLRFRHPLIRAAVAERCPAVERGRAHARAARLLAERGRPPGVVAAHLLAAPPSGDAWAAETLRAPPREARAQGAPELAATYLRRALAELPTRAASRCCSSSGGPSTRPGRRMAPGRLREAWELTGDVELALELGDDARRADALGGGGRGRARARVADRPRARAAAAGARRGLRADGPADRRRRARAAASRSPRRSRRHARRARARWPRRP